MGQDTIHHHTVSLGELSAKHDVHLRDDVVEKVLSPKVSQSRNLAALTLRIVLAMAAMPSASRVSVSLRLPSGASIFNWLVALTTSLFSFLSFVFRYFQ